MKTRASKSKNRSAQLYLRLPEEMRETLAGIAAGQGRSLNSLLVEILSGKLASYQAVKSLTDNDPLFAAYVAANTIEEYANAIRASILMRKMRDGDIEVNEKTYPGISALAPDAMSFPPSIKQDDLMTVDEKRLADAFKNLDPAAKSALLTLLERG